MHETYNYPHSLIEPVARGNFTLSVDMPRGDVPDLPAMCGYVVENVINALDTETIGNHNELTPEQLKPECFTVLITSITSIY